MRLVIAVMSVMASLAWTACSLADPAPAVYIDPGKSFSLRAGAFAQAHDQKLIVGFDGVSADSRCPKGEQCVWAGDATVKVWIQQGTGSKETYELHVAPGPAQAVRILGHELRLLRLEPYPLAGKPIAKGDYTATLTLGSASAAESDR